MDNTFDKKLTQVGLRCHINLLLEQLGRILLIAGGGFVGVVVCERFLGIELISHKTVDNKLAWTAQQWLPLAISGIITIGVLLLWWLKRPSTMRVATMIDQQLRLNERYSTTLALGESDDPFARAACDEARKKAGQVSVKGYFPIRLSKRWRDAGITWAVAIGFLFFMPQKDLLGFLAEKQKKEDDVKQAAKVKTDIRKEATIIKQMVSKMADPQLAETLGALDKPLEGAKPEANKRQAIRKMGDLADQIKQKHQMQMDAAKMMQKMFKQMKGQSDEFSQKLLKALARNNFAQASDLIKKMQNQLESGKLTDQQKKDLANKLQQLSKQIEKMSKEKGELEKELEKMGLKKEMAKLSEKELRKALEKAGLNKDQLEKLMQKCKANQSACNMCDKLGKAMASCGSGSSGISGDQLAALSDQLDNLEAMAEQLKLAQASLDQISQCIGKLGEGMCSGMGMGTGDKPAYKDYARGQGIGAGARETATSGESKTVNTKVQGKSQKGPIVASWYIKDTQVKGEARREFSEVVQAARDNASEAISENRIPRKYENTVKKYFGDLGETTKGNTESD
ncbi:MAG: hypothetical protein K9M57_09575 [Phycisphaerae bacterium]|nr:hypothetical protein [Phycisphaerae bacterium]